MLVQDLADKDYRIIIAIPTYDGWVADMLVPIIYGMELPPVQFVFVHGCYVDYNRNLLVQGAFGKEYEKSLGGPMTHILFVDSDTIPMNNDATRKLLEADKDIIAGIAPQKRIPSPWMLWNWKDRDSHAIESITIADPTDPMHLYPEMQDRVLEVDTISFGWVLVKREVFEQIKPPWFQNWMTPNLQFQGEDVNFCHKAQEYGFKVYAHTGVMCMHKEGRKLYPNETQALFDNIRQRYRLVAKKEEVVQEHRE